MIAHPCPFQPRLGFQIQENRGIRIPDGEQPCETVYRLARDAARRPLIGARGIMVPIAKHGEATLEGRFYHLSQMLAAIGQIEQKFAERLSWRTSCFQQDPAQGFAKFSASRFAGHQAGNPLVLQIGLSSAYLEAFARAFNPLKCDKHAKITVG
jgi:hypothetical protein